MKIDLGPRWAVEAGAGTNPGARLGLERAADGGASVAPAAEMVTITVDGRMVQAPRGMLLVEAAKLAGVEIPVFCYHPKLDPAGVCRMCLVEIEKVPKPVTACTTPVTEGMVVHTDTQAVAELRKGVLEFLLINHPLDCPICDKGGECDLQDLTFEYGPSSSRLLDGKVRKPKAVDLGPFIVLDEERCILCRRCTRFDDEIAAEGNLIIAARGHENVVTTSDGHPYDSYFSGNTIELCPVGALTSDLFRFKARPWDLSHADAVCNLCPLQCSIRIDYRHGRVVRILSRDNAEINNGWLCDRGRFNYNYLNVGGRVDDPAETVRLVKPLVRRGGRLEEATWHEAIRMVADRLREIIRRSGPEAVGVIGGGRLTNEEAYLLQKMARAVIGTPNVDHRAGRQYVASSARFDGRITDLDRADAILIVDVLPAERAPVLDLRVRRAMERRGARVVAVGSAMPSYRARHGRAQVRPGEVWAALEQIAANLRPSEAAADPSGMAAGPSVIDAEQARQVAATLAGASHPVVLWGGEDPQVGRALHRLLARLPDAKLLILSETNNARGAEWMGVRPDLLPGLHALEDKDFRRRLEESWKSRLPERPGLDTRGMLEAAADGRIEALWFVGANPMLSYPDGGVVARALERASLVVVQDLFLTRTAELAHVVLPAAPQPAKPGSSINLDGQLQGFGLSMPPGGLSQPDSVIFEALARAMDAQLYTSAEGLEAELANLLGHRIPPNGRTAPERVVGAPDALMLGGESPGGRRPAEGRADALAGVASRPEALQLVPVDRLFAGGGSAAFDPDMDRVRPEPFARLHPADALELDVGEGDRVAVASEHGSLSLIARVSFAVVPGTVQVPLGLPSHPANRLGPAGTPVTLTVVQPTMVAVGASRPVPASFEAGGTGGCSPAGGGAP